MHDLIAIHCLASLDDLQKGKVVPCDPTGKDLTVVCHGKWAWSAIIVVVSDQIRYPEIGVPDGGGHRAHRLSGRKEAIGMSSNLRWSRAAVMAGVCLLLAAFAGTSFATVYQVGPGKPYATIGAIPAVLNGTLAAGDTVNIYPKAGNAPYYEKVALSNNGTAANPITFQGVPDALGNRPILDGTNAVQVGSAYNLDRGLIQTGSGNSGSGNYIIIQNLELRNAYKDFLYVRSGTYYAYGKNAAGVFVQNGANVVIRNCWIHGNGNGIQTGGKSQGVTNLLIEACRVEGNGVVNLDGTGDSQEHNFYIGSEPITVQYCYIGTLRAGADGQNYKDRGSGSILRYNWIEGGPNDQFDLVDGGTQPANAYIYGNVIIKNNNSGNGRMCLFGGDSGGNRAGTLYFMNNTFITTRSSGVTTVFQLSPAGNTVQAYNNVMYCPLGGSYLLIQSDATAVCAYNWISPGFSSGGASMTNTIPGSGNAPGFVNEAGKDFHLAAGSACINAGATTWPAQASTTAILQPIQPLLYEPRPSDSHIDIGAYEYVAPPPHVSAFAPALGQVSHLAAALSQMTITFDRDVTISTGMVSVVGANTGPKNTFTLTYSSATCTATLQWPSGLPNDTYTVTVADGVTAGGVALDGEMDLAAPTLPSGNGTAGGAFTVYVRRLVGDINQDQSVDVLDLVALAGAWGTSTGQPGFDPACDLNGDGSVDVTDLLILAENWNLVIP
jgi:hypothetical protein